MNGSVLESVSEDTNSPFLHPGAAVHLGQSWYHGRISREEAQDLIKAQGGVDGLFLLRESLSIAGTFVLTLAHDLKIRHFRISNVSCFFIEMFRMLLLFFLL